MADKEKCRKIEQHNQYLNLVDDSVSLYVRQATSDNTRRNYQSDLKHYVEWGGGLPTAVSELENYLIHFAPLLNSRTIKRRLISIRQWHKLQGVSDPTQHPIITKTIKGIARVHGLPKKQATALKLADLDQIVAHLVAQSDLKSLRNRAMILLGFFGAFRRSELVSLTWEQISFGDGGITVKLNRSKTDQTGEGADCVIRVNVGNRCPVQALIDWRVASNRYAGAIFSKFSKTGRLLDRVMSADGFNSILKSIALDAKISYAKNISAHSLRRGFATEASRLGASMPTIQKHGRWRSTKTVLEYIEAGRQFKDSAGNVFL
jgi:site-specific recombinase XerD